MTRMKKWLVNGGLFGHVNPAADETTLAGRFEEWYDDLADALDRGRELCGRLGRGGLVCVGEEDRLQEGFPVPTAPVALASRSAEGEDVWHVRGVDLRSAAAA